LPTTNSTFYIQILFKGFNMPANSANPTQNKQRPKVLVFTSKAEFHSFLSDLPLLEELQTISDWTFHLTDDRAPDEVLEATLIRVKPDILVGTWSTPFFGDSFPSTEYPYPNYYCYLCGSMRHRVNQSKLANGLIATNWGETAAAEVAEHALHLILSSLRLSTHYTLALHREKAWRGSPNPPKTFFGKTLGIHGFGSVARQLIKLCQPFGVTCRAYSKPVPLDYMKAHGATSVSSLEELFSESDIIVEAEGSTPATAKCVDEKLLRMIKPGGVFINIARGEIVDQCALAQVASEGNILVGLDVFDPEPLPTDSPLRGLRNVYLSPHIAGPTVEGHRRCGQFGLENIQRYLRGQPVLARISETFLQHTT
jgi:phosphoglycerate dehydrogenase-like enzyme